MQFAERTANADHSTTHSPRHRTIIQVAVVMLSAAAKGAATRRRNQEAARAKGHGISPLKNYFLPGRNGQPSSTTGASDSVAGVDAAVSGASTSDSANEPSAARSLAQFVVPSDRDVDDVIVTGKRERKQISYALPTESIDLTGDGSGEDLPDLADMPAFKKSKKTSEAVDSEDDAIVPLTRKRKPFSNFSFGNDEVAGSEDDEIVPRTRTLKRKPFALGDVDADDVFAPVPGPSVDVDDESNVNVRDPLKLAQLRSVIPEPDDGSDVPSDLTSVLEHMFEYFIFWVVHEAPYAVEIMERLVDYGAVKFADNVVEHMVPALRTYLEQCIHAGSAWDLRKITGILDSMAIKDSDKKRGAYMIVLAKTLAFVPYVGSSDRCDYDGMWGRLVAHLSPAKRATQPKKTLYRAWDSKSSPVADEDVHLAGVLHLDSVDCIREGPAFALACETILITLLCGGFQPMAPLHHRFDASKALPESLIRRVREVAEAQGCDTISDGDSNCSILCKAMGFASGLKVSPSNWAHPYTDSRVNFAHDATRLLEGATRKLCLSIHENLASFQLWTNFTLRIEKAELFSAGFSPKEPSVTLKLSLSDEFDSENWARLKESDDGITKANPDGFELAQRIRLTVSFIAEGGIVCETIVHSPKMSNKTPFALAMLSMTMLEYANGTLPNRLPLNGRRRVDMATPQREQGEKAWDGDAPETALTEHQVRFRAKAKKDHESERKHVLQCPSSKCPGPRFEKGKGKRWSTYNVGHMVKHLWTKENATKCGTQLGLTSVDEIDNEFLKTCVIPGVDYEPKLTVAAPLGPAVCECLGCGKTFHSKANAGKSLVHHLFKSNRLLQSCRDAFGLTDESEATSSRVMPYAQVVNRQPLPASKFK
jgi:hypothetical protein